MKVVFATGNKGKIREIEAVYEGTGIEIISMKDAGISVSIDENGKAFADNALIKARTVHDAIAQAMESGEYADDEMPVVMADDSGLVVDALGGEPGVYSARYMGEETSYDIKNAEIIRRVEGLAGSERSARFTAVIAAVLPDGRELTAEAHMEGEIAYEPAGENGFGYDPILYLPGYGMTSAQLPSEEKNRISHRGKGLRMMRELLEKS